MEDLQKVIVDNALNLFVATLVSSFITGIITALYFLGALSLHPLLILIFPLHSLICATLALYASTKSEA